MRASTVHELHGIDVAGNVRAEMARANVSASMLSRIYGGSVTYTQVYVQVADSAARDAIMRLAA